MSSPAARPAFSTQFLKALQETVSKLRRPARGIPLAGLMELAAHAENCAGLAVDFTAAQVLGYPLVVVSAPARDLSAGVLSVLSRRERQVAAQIAQGLTNKQIAAKLRISTLTVKDHVHNILSKTGLANRTALAAAHK